jgi:hypothetical protein
MPELPVELLVPPDRAPVPPEENWASAAAPVLSKPAKTKTDVAI